MRPIPPDPNEHRRIRKAYRAAVIADWTGRPMALISLVSALLTWRAFGTLWAVIVLAVPWALFLGIAFGLARYPRCGQRWSLPAGGAGLTNTSDPEAETESFVCRRCRVHIGLALRS